MGMGIGDRSVRRSPSYPHPSKLKEIPKVLPQVTGVPVHLPPFRIATAPQVLTIAQVNTQAVVDLTQSLVG